MRKFINIPLILILIAGWITIISSCANQGMPTGGDKDTIPPILLKAVPVNQAVNFTGDEVKLTFNEFIRPDKISQSLIVSPPLQKRPTIRTKGKSILVSFNEDLRDSVTYSLNFGNAIIDNNEGNPIESFIHNFSTYDGIDTLRIAGKIIDAFTLNPVENTLVVLHSNINDTAVTHVIPDYITKTDENGYFVFMNLPQKPYHIFSFEDKNSNYKYEVGAETIAFIDSVYTPYTEIHTEIDSTLTGLDSMMSHQHTHFYPKPIYLRQFEEYVYNQYLETYKRENQYHCTFIFNKTVKDTFNIRLLNDEKQKDWYQMEYNPNKDSIAIWITDTLLAKTDTLRMELTYSQLDSLKKITVVKDSLNLIFTEKPKEKKRKKKKEEKPKPIEQFMWKTNLSGDFDLNKSIQLVAPQPISQVNQEGMRLYLSEDTLKNELEFTLIKDTSAWRTYVVQYPWQPEEKYTFEIDSAASSNIYGITNKKFARSFKTRSQEYYGSIKIKLNNATFSIIMQLLSNSDKEKILMEKVAKNNEVDFDYLYPGKYVIKVIYDNNNNGKWDAGSWEKKIQPERITYVNEVIKIRSNWEYISTLNLTPDPTFKKDVVDKELEEKKRKEAAEKKRKEKKQENKKKQTGRTDLFKSSGVRGGFR